MRCEYILSSNSQCKRSGNIEMYNKKYCLSHYNIVIRFYNKYYINEDEYRNKVINILNSENIQFTKLEFINSDYFILIYKITINNIEYICKIQLIEDFKSTSLYNDYIIVKNILTDKNLILSLADIKNFYYKPKKYIIVLNQPILCTLDSIINVLDKETIYYITLKLIEIIEYIHNNKYLYLNLSINKLVLTDSGIKILLYNPCSKFINDRSEFYPNISIRDMLGDSIYGSININNMFSGTRLDDLESIFWIFLKMIKDPIIDDLVKSKSILVITKLKEGYFHDNLQKKEEEYSNFDKIIIQYIKELNKQLTTENIKPIYFKFKSFFNSI